MIVINSISEFESECHFLDRDRVEREWRERVERGSKERMRERK